MVLTKERERKQTRIEKWIIITLISIRNYRVYSLLYFKHKIHHEFYFHERVIKRAQFRMYPIVNQNNKVIIFQNIFFLKYIIFIISTLKLLKNIKNNFK